MRPRQHGSRHPGRRSAAAILAGALSVLAGLAATAAEAEKQPRINTKAEPITYSATARALAPVAGITVT